MPPHPPPPDDDRQLHCLAPDPAVEAELGRPGLSFTQAVATVLSRYASRPALGERRYEIVRDPQSGAAARQYRPAFDTVTYAELRRRIEALASAWRRIDRWRVEPGDRICTLGFNGIDEVTVDLACLYVQGISVPLQGSMGAAALEKILGDTAPRVIAVHVRDAAFAAGLAAERGSVRALVVIGHDDRVDEDRDACAEARAVLAHRSSRVALVTLAELVAAGSEFAWEPLPQNGQGAERIAMLMHSSGTTGTPKGAILLERHAQSALEPSKSTQPRVRLCIAPMSHTMGRGTIYGTLAHGGTAFFVTRPDMSTLFEDIRLVRPTDMYFFPRALEMVHRHFTLELARRLQSADGTAQAVRAQVLAEIRGDLLGGRLRLIKGGGAPTKPEVRRFVVEDLQIEFFERYGTTEAGSITINERVRRPQVIDYELRDVPELGYRISDKPYPRGELAVKTATMIPGYFGKAGAAASLFDARGFILTGDIVEERGPDHLVYVDRRGDVLKLAQGEFVAAGALGTLFEDACEVIQQAYVYGSPTRAYLLAVIVPNLEAARLRIGREPDEADLRMIIKSELRQAGASAGLKAFEIPRDFILENEPFSERNGLLTGVRKLIRPAMLRVYQGRLEQLYADLERRHSEEIVDLLRAASELSVLEKVGKALETVLDLEYVDVEHPGTFRELGGDSLAATELGMVLEDIFGVALPVTAILSPTGHPKDWARRIERKLADDAGALPPFAKVHRDAATHGLQAADLRLDAFLDPALLQDLPAPALAGRPRTVLLTGATGFLGRFLCLEWLETLAASGGTLICLVRGHGRDEARRRLDSLFGDSGSALAQRYQALAKDHLDVLCGDLAEPRLGVSEAEYEMLATSVDRIVHAAALVNHVLDYEHLFEPNVASTAALIGLALARRRKAFDFVSSTAVFGLLDRDALEEGDWPLRQRAALTQRYAAGYRASKWAAEHLLQAAGRLGLSVNIFRSGMVLPHRHFHSQLNAQDIFARLLHSVVATGLAPVSFYLPAPAGKRVQARYDGLPVDFTAAAIVGIATATRAGANVYNMLGGRGGDGASLDDVVDWIEAAGYPVTRVADYDEWLARLEDRLRRLPEIERQHSSLPVLESLRHRTDPGKSMPPGDRFDNALRQLRLEAPRVTREYIHKCLDDMRRLNLIRMPEQVPAPT